MILRGSRLAVAFLLPLLACDVGPFGPDDDDAELADIGTLGPDIRYEVEGRDVSLVIMTYGPNSCYRYHHDDVKHDGDDRVITIRPYNAREGDGCRQAIIEIPHEMTIFQLAEGEWTIRVIGRSPAMPGSAELVVDVPVNVGGAQIGASQ